MRQVIESYAAIFVILIMFLLGMAFTTVNLNVTQARKIYNDIKAEVQASNGSILLDDNPEDGRFYYNSEHPEASGRVEAPCTIEKTGYRYEYSVTRQDLDESAAIDSRETYIYNDLYKISLRYEYYVPLFGYQVYPMTGFTN